MVLLATLTCLSTEMRSRCSTKAGSEKEAKPSADWKARALVFVGNGPMSV